MSQDDHMLVDLNPPYITFIYLDYSYINEQGILLYLLNYTKYSIKLLIMDNRKSYLFHKNSTIHAFRALCPTHINYYSNITIYYTCITAYKVNILVHN